MSVPGRIGSHQSALAAAVENRGSTAMILAPPFSPVANAVIWEVKTFSPRWLPMRTTSFDDSRSIGSGDPSAWPNVKRVAHFARAAALRERGFGAVRGAVRAHQRAEEARPDAVREERRGLGTVGVLDRLQLRGQEVQGLVPADPLELPVAAFARPEHRVLEPVRVVQEPGPGVASRAQTAPRQGVVRVPLEPDHVAARDAREHAAAPEAHLADRGDLLDALLSAPAGRVGPRLRRRRHDRRACAGGGDGAEELPPRKVVRAHVCLTVAAGGNLQKRPARSGPAPPAPLGRQQRGSTGRTSSRTSRGPSRR